MCTIGSRNDGLEALPSPSPLCTAEPGYTIHTPLGSRHLKSLHDRISIFGLDTGSVYLPCGYCNAATSLLPPPLSVTPSLLLPPSSPLPPSLLPPPSLSSQVEGTFLLDIPPVLLGYEHPSSLITTQTLTSDLKSSGHTHLQLFIALEPPLSVLPPIKDQVGMNQACMTLDTKFVIPV